MYLDRTRILLGGGSFYPPQHLAGPYVLTGDAILYPPTTIPLFALFLLFPAALFWIVPGLLIAGTIWYHRPAFWAWPLIAACVAYTPTIVKVIHGNPVMWAAAALAIGTIHRWPSVFVLIKPSLGPLALVGANHSSWWRALLGFAIAGVLLLPLWIDYALILEHARGPLATPSYSLAEVPLMLVPVIAWRSSTRRTSSAPI
jgi:hypothetical protein